MNFSEKELEDWLYANPEEVGVEKWVGRQIRLPSGILDLVGIRDAESPEHLLVIELKAVPLSSSAVLQSCRYAADLLKIPGVCSVAKMCIGVGDFPNELLYAADSVGVELRTVNPSFNIGCEWIFTDEKKHSDEEIISRISQDSIFFRNLRLRRETVRGLWASLNSKLSPPTSLLMDIADDFDADLSYEIYLRRSEGQVA